jgi:hypothetical protein
MKSQQEVRYGLLWTHFLRFRMEPIAVSCKHYDESSVYIKCGASTN